jgi:hypothetical protein
MEGQMFESKSTDTRSLYDKLIALSRDKGATPPEREAAAQKARELLARKIAAKEQEEREKSPLYKTYYDFINAQMQHGNAGWQSKPEVKRSRRGNIKPRSQRVHKTFYTILMREAQERAKYREKYYNEFMGLKDHKDIETARAKIIEMMGMPNIERHICIINGKLTKLFLFWNFGITRDITWFFIERDTVTGKTKKSKRYFTRDAAMSAFHGDNITFVRTEII